METADELQREDSLERSGDGVRVQAGVYFLELSLDWIIRRASENISDLLAQPLDTLIDEPLAKFVDAQALHDVRNLFARLSATLGVTRAYAVRLTSSGPLVDIAFQQVEGHVLLEAVPSSSSFGECFGTIAGLVDGMSEARGQALLEAAARRMRALTGYDRVTLSCGNGRAESSRGSFSDAAPSAENLPPIIADTSARPVRIFPCPVANRVVGTALMRSCPEHALGALRAAGIKGTLRVKFAGDRIVGEFRCDSRSPRAPNFELHAAAELFAQLVALRLELDRLRP